MIFRTFAAAALIGALVLTPATAAPVTVNLRVEGSSTTLFEGPITTDGRPVDGGDGTGPHKCDGTNGAKNPSPGPTMTAALDDAKVAGGWHGAWDPAFEDFLLDTIGGETGTTFDRYWGTAVDYQPALLGGCQQRVEQGDELLFALGDIFSQPLLRLNGPTTAAAGPVRVTVVDGKTNAPVEGAAVSAPGATATTQADGSAIVGLAPGIVRLKASKAGAIRSNAMEICVFSAPSDCTGFVPATGPQVPVHDTRAPAARIVRPRHGRRYAVGPRLLRGSATDAEGSVTEVKLALRRHVDGRCRWWSGRRERFVGTNCHKVFFFAIGDDAEWSYLMPHRLPRGRYVLDVKAFDRARNREESFVAGRNRVVFRVAPRKRVRAKPRVARRRGAAAVDVMVVGEDGAPLAGPKRVRARSSLVTASGRACRVARSTPLAALARALRGVAGYHATDYGRCSRRDPASSAQLFVDRVGSQRNRGQDGWFYKVNDRAGTAGAGDPAGPRGRGRLRRGDRVLWFYCLFGRAGPGCQRSLRIVVPRGQAAAVGAPLRASVRAYDDEGRAHPARGAVLALGGRTAVTGADGGATLVPAAAGRLPLRATLAGATPAFPRIVMVR